MSISPRKRVKDISIATDEWQVNGDNYYVNVSSKLSEHTANSKFDIQVSDDVIRFCNSEQLIAFIPVNDNGTLRIISIRNKPSSTIVVRCVLNEVTI